MSSFIQDLARDAAGPWTPVIASLLGAVVGPLLTGVVGRSAARGVARERASLELAQTRNEQRIRTGDISGTANIHQTIDHRQYSSTTIHQPAASSSDRNAVAAWLVAAFVVTVVVVSVTAWLGPTILAALPWATTTGAAVLLLVAAVRRRAGERLPAGGLVVGVGLAGLCWAVAHLVGGNSELEQAITSVQTKGYKFGDPSAGMIVWMFVAIALLGLAAVAIQGLATSVRLRDAAHPQGRHWTENFVGPGGFRLWLRIAAGAGALLVLVVLWPSAKSMLGL